MALVLKGGAVFLHVPKTGGSFISDALTSANLVERSVGHIHADLQSTMIALHPLRAAWGPLSSRARSTLPLAVKRRMLQSQRDLGHQGAGSPKHRVFLFVREPLSWYRSFWRYMNDRNGSDWSLALDLRGNHPCAPLRHLGSATFIGFLENVVEKEPGFLTNLYTRYIGPDVAFVGHQERLVDDLIECLRQLEVDFDESMFEGRKRVNQSRTPASPIAADLPIFEQIRRLEHPASVRFGYESADAGRQWPSRLQESWSGDHQIEDE